MGERFSLRMTIGGDLPEDKVPKLIESLSTLNPYVNLAPPGEFETPFDDLKDPSGWLKLESDADGVCLEIYDYDGSWDEWEGTSSELVSLGLSYDYTCEPKYEFAGTFELHRLGKPLIRVEINGSADAMVPANEIRKILCAHIVSQAELRRALDELVPSTAVPMDQFRIVP